MLEDKQVTFEKVPPLLEKNFTLPNGGAPKDEVTTAVQVVCFPALSGFGEHESFVVVGVLVTIVVVVVTTVVVTVTVVTGCSAKPARSQSPPLEEMEIGKVVGDVKEEEVENSTADSTLE